MAKQAPQQQPDYEPSPIIPIGEKKYLCVEYPGYVKRTKRALQTLGGEKGLAEALANNTTVELKYRPGDIFSHGIHGQILTTSKLLVKVTRRVKRKDRMTEKEQEEEVEEDTEIKWKTEIKGVVTKTVRFRALADFQYIVPKDDKVRQLKTALTQGDVDHIMKYKVATDDDNTDDLRNIPPPLFSPTEGALDYGYRQNQPVLRVRVRQPDGSFKVKLLNRSRRTGFEITSVRFSEENVPTKSWHNIPSITKPEEDRAVAAVAALFQERPIWSRFAVKNRLPAVHHAHIKTALIRNAYTFVDGPWRDCWVKYGLDPRKDQSCHIYQQVDVRRFFSLGPRPADSRQRKAQRKRREMSAVKNTTTDPKKSAPLSSTTTNNGEPENKHIFDGKSIPGASSLYQMCDIIDPEISLMIRNPNYLKSEPSKYCGFYYQCVIERIRKSVRKKHISLVETEKADSIPDIEEGLMDDVVKERESKKEVEGYEGIVEGEEGVDGDSEEEVEVVATGDASSSSTTTTKNKKPASVPKDKESAVKEAMKEMKKPDTSKRLKEVVDDYMDELVKGGRKSKASSGFEEEEEVDLDVMDTLEEYDEEEFEAEVVETEKEDETPAESVQEEEEEESSRVKPEPMDEIPADEDVSMEDP